jgi:hypothetical protein
MTRSKAVGVAIRIALLYGTSLVSTISRDFARFVNRLTRRYLNIGRNSHKLYRYLDGKYVEITRAAALERVRG